MNKRTVWIVASLSCLGSGSATAADTALARQNEQLFQQLQEIHELSDGQMQQIRAIFARSGYIGQGNPAISEHPVTPQQCAARIAQQKVDYANREFEKICHARYMAPLYNPKTQQAQDAKACIDQFEFPDIPCSYPVVWVRAREAAEICAAEGKRLCDAHEWEGACAGTLEPPDYRFDLAKGAGPDEAIRRMRIAHNKQYEAHKSWSYGPSYQKGICATASHKTPGCLGGGWTKCGSNTYPAGDFPACHSPLGVYDLNGNAAEHMNLPLSESQMSSRGSKVLGYTEMKGSWLIFDTYRAHEDWCRWRAPFWHGTRVMDDQSHANYHLGFRCCKDTAPQ
ncbi:Sulfatase-modifying factor enzyme 1 [Georgfuchsia toluolica]|uniref:Sulfatase-modifying factor enzyme 1 n=1 Tax=Georgfuchsia toluolica TaxID=424218 RepID=A0A916N1Y4_9PROT|nr:SUMF1/EgtB/PvdO family nonheme iron enzyme [Georgfuchsia toluolica]CAG4883209.1 Sulfatase-modifying factor enzyme 1 [Georgfuchsia toluolica]